ncbi:hypothetical protein A6J88_13380 [Neisseria mucosa]|uniref:Phage abortive infection protein n=1 Tax=Neisseria mucosa TaxID=488 RepID=A0ABM6JFQ4_NEIMU|nr:putative phage abortive infection protein [Neisseria mucosa]ARC52067.1 hypothetical protein A6J88_13380 [Neisseria mucosa]
MDKGNKPNRLLWVLGGIAVAAFIFVLERYINNFKTFPIANDSATWGTFGDYLGGTLNPIISFLALIGLLYTIHQQAQEMQATREELKQAAEQQRQQVEQQSRQSEIFNLQQFESTFFSLLEQHNKIIEKVETDLNKINGDIERRYKGLDTITETPPSEEMSNYHAIEIINHNHTLKGYFDLLFQMLKFICISLSKRDENKEPANNDEKNTKIKIEDFLENSVEIRQKISTKYINIQEQLYSDILRSFIPNEILKLLALYCLTPDKYSENKDLETPYSFQGLLNRYKLLEQLQLDLKTVERILDSSEVGNFVKNNPQDKIIHFLILTSYTNTSDALGENSILKKLKPKFREQLDQSIDKSIKKYLKKYKETQEKYIKNFHKKLYIIINDYYLIKTEYNKHTKLKKQSPFRLDDLEFSDIEITNDDFDTWRNKYIKALTRKIKTYEENTNKPDTDIELKQLENNKKAWLEFLQIEED